MTNLIPLDSEKKQAYLQRIETQQDALTLRKKLAKEHGLLSISEFVEGRATVYKDGVFRIMNEQGEYMRDPKCRELTLKQRTREENGKIVVENGRIVRDDYFIDGNFKELDDDSEPTDIIESPHRIFTAKEGIIIVVDDRSYGPGGRYYTTKGTRISMPEGWEFDRFVISEHNARDHLSRLSLYKKNCSHIYDRRENIIWGMLPIELAHTFRSDNYGSSKIRKIREEYNIFDDCTHNLLTPEGNHFTTQNGYYYACNKRPFDGAVGLLPTISNSLSKFEVWKTEDVGYLQNRAVFHAIDRQGKIFKDEFGGVVLFDDPYRLNAFDKDGYAPLVVNYEEGLPTMVLDEHRLDSYNRLKHNAYLCFIHKDGHYRKNGLGKIITIGFHKTISASKLTVPDVHGYKAFPDEGVVRVTRKGMLTEKLYERTITYQGNDLVDAQYTRKDKVNRGPQAQKVYIEFGNGLIAYGSDRKRDDGGHREFCYGGVVKIINRKFDDQHVKFPDGKDGFALDLNELPVPHQQGYIMGGHDIVDGHEHRRSTSYLKINGLVARYGKDSEGNELKSLVYIESILDKFLVIQRNNNEPYYILDKDFSYLKDEFGQKRGFKFQPIYADGVFLEFVMLDDELTNCHDVHGKQMMKSQLVGRVDSDFKLANAYFEDGTRVGEVTEGLSQMGLRTLLMQRQTMTALQAAKE